MQTRIGKYELKKALGQGASGKVYLALDTYAGKDVALKVIDARVLMDPELGELTRGRFANEAMLAGRLTRVNWEQIVKRVLVFLNYWILGTLNTEGRRRRYNLREAWERATILARLPKI